MAGWCRVGVGSVLGDAGLVQGCCWVMGVSALSSMLSLSLNECAITQFQNVRFG